MIERLPLLHTLTSLNAPIVILNGLPGSGKSVVLRQLAKYLGCDVSKVLPSPGEHGDNAHLIWDPVGRGFYQHLDQVLQLCEELEIREQTLFISASWVGNNKILSQALLYGKLAIIDQSELMFSEQEISTLYPSESSTIYLHTKGWPVLVSNWAELGSERYKESLQEYVKARILPTLPYHEQRLLIALAFCSAIPLAQVNVEKTHIEVLAPLIILEKNSQFVLGIPYLKQTLIDIAKADPRVYQETMRLVAKNHFYMNNHLIAIKTAIETNNLDLAIKWFKKSGGGMYGYRHSFGELEQLLDCFPEEIIESNLHLSLAKTIYFLKNQRLLEAREFIERLNLSDQRYTRNKQDQAVATLIQGKYEAYFTSDPHEIRVNKLLKLEFILASDPDAMMIYYGMVSINYSNLGNWFQAAVYQQKELDLATKCNVPYLKFYSHFNLARINLRMGFIEIAEQHVLKAKKNITRIGYYQSLSFERNFIDLIDGMLALLKGDIKLAYKLWDKVGILRKHSEVWPEFLTQFHFYGISCHLIANETEQATSLLDQLHYEYRIYFSDEQGNIYFNLLAVLILQQQQRWVEAEHKLTSIETKDGNITGSVLDLYRWMSRRNEVGLICIHRSRKHQTFLPVQYKDTPWTDVCYALQDLKLLWFNQEYTLLAPRLLSLFQRANELDLWLPLLFEMEWLNQAVKKVKSSAKNRIRHTHYERTLLIWTEKSQQSPRSTNTDELTAKQLLIVQRLGEGLSNKQIAQYTGLSENTVKFHLKNLFKRFDLESRQSLVQLANQKGWIR
ncbi:LuxR C-terminal-related transcriptional regulator [Vibrio sp. RC27]